MNKKHLIESVAKTLGDKTAPTAVEAVLDAITRELAAGGRITLTGFGTFETFERPAYEAHNPKTLEPLTVPARILPRFRAGQNLRDLTNGDKPVPVDGSAIAKAPKGSLNGGAR